MNLKRKNVGIMIGLSAAIGAMVFGNMGCADNSPNTSLSGLETQVSDIPASAVETIDFDMEASDIENYDMETFDAEASDIEAAADDASEEEISVGDVHLFEQEDKISTMFYDLCLDKVTVTDSIGDMTAESGREFLILDVTVTAGDAEPVISMYAQEFLLVCFVGDSLKSDSEEDYEKLYPLEAGLAQGQLDDVWLAMTGEDQKGKLIYNVPKDTVRTVLLVYDCYRAGELNKVVYGDGYMMMISKENWIREE